MKNTVEQLERFVTVGRAFWNLLTEDEKANYYAGTGTYSFIEDIASILHIHHEIYDLTQDEFEVLHNRIIYPEDRCVIGGHKYLVHGIITSDKELYNDDLDTLFVYLELQLNGGQNIYGEVTYHEEIDY